MLLSLNPNTPPCVRDISSSSIHPKTRNPWYRTILYCQVKMARALRKPYETVYHRPAMLARYVPDCIFHPLKEILINI